MKKFGRISLALLGTLGLFFELYGLLEGSASISEVSLIEFIYVVALWGLLCSYWKQKVSTGVDGLASGLEVLSAFGAIYLVGVFVFIAIAFLMAIVGDFFMLHEWENFVQLGSIIYMLASMAALLYLNRQKYYASSAEIA